MAERHRCPLRLLESVEALLPEVVELDRLLETFCGRTLQLKGQEATELRDGKERAVAAVGVHLPLLLPVVLAFAGHYVAALLLLSAVALVVALFQQPFSDVLDALSPLPGQLGPLLARPVNP